jgi:glycerol-3-phosphate dehydrogenase
LHIDVYDDLANYVNLSGVRSTGLTASAAIGRYVVNLMQEHGLEAQVNWQFDPIRTGIPAFHAMTPAEQEEIIKADSLYANVVCRCETITEGEIVRAIHSPIPAHSVDAVKRRVRAGMGRCQGGFCGPKVIEILARELGVAQDEIVKEGHDSPMLVGTVK